MFDCEKEVRAKIAMGMKRLDEEQAKLHPRDEAGRRLLNSCRAKFDQAEAAFNAALAEMEYAVQRRPHLKDALEKQLRQFGESLG
jgi:hypothetical protein